MCFLLARTRAHTQSCLSNLVGTYNSVPFKILFSLTPNPKSNPNTYTLLSPLSLSLPYLNKGKPIMIVLVHLSLPYLYDTTSLPVFWRWYGCVAGTGRLCPTCVRGEWTSSRAPSCTPVLCCRPEASSWASKDRCWLWRLVMTSPSLSTRSRYCLLKSELRANPGGGVVVCGCVE